MAHADRDGYEHRVAPGTSALPLFAGAVAPGWSSSPGGSELVRADRGSGTPERAVDVLGDVREALGALDRFGGAGGQAQVSGGGIKGMANSSSASSSCRNKMI
jgi:hypothetical protein